VLIQKSDVKIRLNAGLTDFFVMRKRLAMHKVIHNLRATRAMQRKRLF